METRGLGLLANVVNALVTITRLRAVPHALRQARTAAIERVSCKNVTIMFTPYFTIAMRK
jgi:hypothetical protein